MSTPAVRALEGAGIDHTLHTYEVEEAVGDGYGEAVAAALGVDSSRVFKTLMAVVDGKHVVAIIPVTQRLSMKKLAAAAGGRRAEMANTADAERLTGYVSGGISPLGQRCACGGVGRHRTHRACRTFRQTARRCAPCRVWRHPMHKKGDGPRTAPFHR